SLRRYILKRNSLYNDIDSFIPTCLRVTIPWTPKIHLAEIYRAILFIGNTSPGVDEITVIMLKVASLAIYSYITRLY
ncbi:hypothetical protein SODALDRAFT_278973, partial [Sodiomyces alkalinus F11]